MVNIVRHPSLFSDIARFDPSRNMDDWLKGFGMRPLLNEMETGSLIKIDLYRSFIQFWFLCIVTIYY